MDLKIHKPNGRTHIGIPRLSFLVVAVLLLSFDAQAQFDQVGQDINGQSGNRFGFGTGVSIAGDGSVLTVGSPFESASVGGGAVRVFELIGNSWVQRGSDLEGDEFSDLFGYSIAITADGNQVVIGDYGDREQGDYAGKAYVFQWDGMSWVQKGSSILPASIGENDQFGVAVDISSDGDHVVVGAQGVEVQVFSWSGTDWERAELPQGGPAVSFSLDGTKVAIGAPSIDTTFIYERIGKNWLQLGNAITAVGDENDFGWSVALSDDGNRVVIGAYNSFPVSDTKGHVRVLDWDGVSWSQVGDSLEGQGQVGWAVDISGTGNTIVVGAHIDSAAGVGTFTGSTRIYTWSGTEWSLFGSELLGSATGDRFGTSVTISKDGTRVAVGAPYNDGGGNDGGEVIVYGFVADLIHADNFE